jgi:hypothetical protein
VPVWNQETFLIKNLGKALNTLYEKRIRTLFNKMLSNKEEYADCMSARGENFSTEALFMILIYEQQKMINELIARLGKKKAP